MSVAKTCLAGGRHEIVVGRSKHVSREAKITLQASEDKNVYYGLNTSVLWLDTKLVVRP
jgi:hypothetical protein